MSLLYHLSMKMKCVKAQWTSQMTTGKTHFKSSQSLCLVEREREKAGSSHTALLVQELNLIFSAFLKKVHLN